MPSSSTAATLQEKTGNQKGVRSIRNPPGHMLITLERAIIDKSKRNYESAPRVTGPVIPAKAKKSEVKPAKSGTGSSLIYSSCLAASLKDPGKYGD
jgi:hypothetical protein